MAGDGCDAVRRRLAAVVRDVAAPGSPFDGLVEEAETARGSGRARPPPVPGRGADAARRSRRPRRVRRPVRAARPRRLRARSPRGRRLRAARLVRPAGGARRRGDRGTGLGRWSTEPPVAWIVASVLGVPLELTESEEGSAFGAALLGGVAAGVFADVHDAVERCVRVRDTGRAKPGLARDVRRASTATATAPSTRALRCSETRGFSPPRTSTARSSRRPPRRTESRSSRSAAATAPALSHTRASTASRGRTRRTRGCSRIRRSTPSTSRCPTGCTTSGR